MKSHIKSLHIVGKGPACIVTVECPFCDKHIAITIKDIVDFDTWINGTLIQNAMPYLDADSREALISGTCDNCWQHTFCHVEDAKIFDALEKCNKNKAIIPPKSLPLPKRKR